MGDEADAIYDRMWECEYDDTQEIIDENAKEGYWETNDGDCIPFDKITARHKQNIIAFCKRNDLTAPKELNSEEEYNDGLQ